MSTIHSSVEMLGLLPYNLMQNTLKLISRYDFSYETMELILKTSDAIDQIKAGINSVVELRQAEQAFIEFQEQSLQSISSTADSQK